MSLAASGTIGRTRHMPVTVASVRECQAALPPDDACQAVLLSFSVCQGMTSPSGVDAGMTSGDGSSASWSWMETLFSAYQSAENIRNSWCRQILLIDIFRICYVCAHAHARTHTLYVYMYWLNLILYYCELFFELVSLHLSLSFSSSPSPPSPPHTHCPTLFSVARIRKHQNDIYKKNPSLWNSEDNAKFKERWKDRTKKKGKVALDKEDGGRD